MTNYKVLFQKNKSAIISLTNEELKKFNFKKGDTEGFIIINYALAIKDTIFAAFIVERDNVVKLSLRSKGDFKVNEIANKYFNGEVMKMQLVEYQILMLKQPLKK